MRFTLLYVLFVVAILVVHFFVSIEFYKAAVMKGWHQKKYLVMAFLLWIVGYLLIIALPDRGGSGMQALESSDLPDI